MSNDSTDLDEFVETVGGAVKDQKTRLTSLETQFDQMKSRLRHSADIEIAGDDFTGEARDSFRTFCKTGDAAEMTKVAQRDFESKGLSVGSDPDGGFAVPRAVDGQIDRLLRDRSPIRGIATVRPLLTSSLKILVDKRNSEAVWAGETSPRPETNSPELLEVEIPACEIFANPAATQSIIDDASFDVEQWLVESAVDEFAIKEGAAFVNGNGVAKPRGFLTYDTSAAKDADRPFGTVQELKTGVDGDFPAQVNGHDGPRVDILIDLLHSLRTGYRQNATWVMNSQTLSRIRKFKDADGNLIFQPGLLANQPDRLLGFPILEAEDMPDIATGSLSIAFGNFQRAYRIVDRIGTRILRDPFTNKPFVHFYTTRRVGGGLVNTQALKLLRFAA